MTEEELILIMAASMWRRVEEYDKRLLVEAMRRGQFISPYQDALCSARQMVIRFKEYEKNGWPEP